MISERLKYVRFQLNLSKKAAAKLIGIPYTTYDSYERAVRYPKSKTLSKIAEVFNLPEKFFTVEEPFLDLNLLISMKSVIVFNLKENHLYNFEKEVSSIDNFLYFRIVDKYIASIENDSGELRITYKIANKNNLIETANYTTGKLRIDITLNETIMLYRFNLLNSLGQQKAIDYINDLVEQEKYTL